MTAMGMATEPWAEGALLEYATSQFYENQGIFRDNPCFRGRQGEEPRAVVDEALKDVGEQVAKEWTSPHPPDSASKICDPWWTRREERLLERLKEEAWTLGLPLIQKAHWPEGRGFAIIMTHDVDTLHPLVEFSSWRFAAHASQALGTLTRHASCIAAMKRVGRTDRALLVPSTLFFMAGYECVKDHRLAGLVRHLAALGFEIGLHATPGARLDPPTLATERDRLRSLSGQEITGVRQHTLAFAPGRSWSVQGQAGFRYDTSFAWNTRSGFRSGSALPFRPLDLANGGTLPVLELPLAYMDWTDLSAYGGAGDMTRNVRDLLTLVHEVHGVLTLDFHNSYLDRWAHGDVFSSYVDLAADFRVSGGWLTDARGCAEWWDRRRRAEVRIHGGSGGIVIENPERIPLLVWHPRRSETRAADLAPVDSPRVEVPA